MLIILVASLNIVSSLLMIVMNRRSEIALLLALGASKNEVKRVFCLRYAYWWWWYDSGCGACIFALWLLGNLIL